MQLMGIALRIRASRLSFSEVLMSYNDARNLVPSVYIVNGRSGHGALPSVRFSTMSTKYYIIKIMRHSFVTAK